MRNRISISAAALALIWGTLTFAQSEKAIPSITAQPTSQTVTVGQTATFSVTATAPSWLDYQWLKNGVAISGATSATYTTPATTSADNGAVFVVVVSNGPGSVTSGAATLTVNPSTVAPTITTQPSNQTVTASQTATFTVAATGTAPVSYQWQKNSMAIGGATSASYTTPATTSSDNGAVFVTVVSNSAGNATSNAATLTVNPAPVAPTITSQPANQTVTAVQTATFSAVATGTAPLSYQWQKNGANISGAISASYTTPATTSIDNGSTFQVVVGNSAGSVTSSAATLTVNPAAVAPTITTQPANQTVTAGQTATFAVAAIGTAPLSYQWQKNGANISGVTSSSYTTTATTSTDNGSTFRVVVTNSAGNATSSAATLTVNPASVAPTITMQPANQTVTVGQTGTFSMVATGTAPLSYQWQKNGVNIGGATAASYATSATTSTDNGSAFAVVVSNTAGTVTSNTATLTVNPAAVAPTITTQPANQTVTAGQTATFAVVATGTAPMSYQWQKNGMAISGAISASYTTPATTSTDNGAIFVVFVSNSAGNATSNTATLTVNQTTVTMTGPLRILAGNPRYFTSDGVHAVLLAGSHTWANLQDQGTPSPATFDNNGYMNFMKAHDFNLMQLWTWWLPNGGTAHEGPVQFTAAPFPWVRTGPKFASDGGLQFDFTQLDQNYFDRMRSRVIQAGQNGIYVSIYLFNGYEFQFDINSNDGNPFESGNNVNSINCPGTCPTDNSQISAQTWTYEKNYIHKVIDTVNDLDNVLYMTSNESGSPYSDTWEASVIAEVKSYEAGKPKQHPVGMGFQYQGGTDQKLYNSAADWVSPAFGGGGLNIPPDAIRQKVIINDTDHDCGICGSQAWAWENFTRGNSMLFMDPYLVNGFGNNPGGPITNGQGATVDPQWAPVRNAMQDILGYANSKIDLVNMLPHDTLSTSGFCLANPGSQYLVYSASNSFTLTTVGGTYNYEWFNPTTHAVVATGSIIVGSSQSFTAPFSGDAVLWLH
jgi:hypothetical protein